LVRIKRTPELNWGLMPPLGSLSGLTALAEKDYFLASAKLTARSSPRGSAEQACVD
jgi:hypothetical protein